MAIVATSSTGTAANQSSSVSASIIIAGANVNVGDCVVVYIAADNAGTSGANAISAVTDNVAPANTYTQLQLLNRTAGSAANDGCTAAIYASIITTQMVTGTNFISVQFSPNVTAKATAYRTFTGVDAIANAYGSGSSSGSGATYTTNATTTNVNNGDLVVGVAANESNTAPAADGDTTNGSWVEATAVSGGSGGDATKMGLRYAYKIVTAGGATQTFNGNTGASTDWAACISVLPAPVVSLPPPVTRARTAWSNG